MRIAISYEEKAEKTEPSPERVNFTEDLQSATSLARQLAEQMTLAKAYVIIAKEHSDLQLAWDLSSRIRSCQLILLKAAMKGEPISLRETYEYIMGLVIFTPIAVLSWFPFVSEFQTRLLFNQAFSRGLQISMILAGKKDKSPDVEIDNQLKNADNQLNTA